MYRKSQRTIALERKLNRCAAMRAAKERVRAESHRDAPGWRHLRSIWLSVYAAPDGRHIELHAASERGEWRRCGSERAVRGALAKMMWRMKGSNHDRP
jgi:ferric-dicitrate binding protein FerR (iron transport regulator)